VFELWCLASRQLGDEAKATCFHLLHTLREHGIPSAMDFSVGKIGKALQHASHIGALYAVVIGDHELSSQEVELREMATGHRTKIPLSNLEDPSFRPFVDI